MNVPQSKPSPPRYWKDEQRSKRNNLDSDVYSYKIMADKTLCEGCDTVRCIHN